jgi:hypothetical protein
MVNYCIAYNPKKDCKSPRLNSSDSTCRYNHSY